MSDCDEEYVYEEDDMYMSDDDGNDGGDGSLEGLYYDAKDQIADDPAAAAEGFANVVEMGDGDAANAKWVWKSLKRLVRVLFSLGRYEEQVRRYKQLLQFEWSGRSRNDLEKAINKLLDATGSSGPVTQMYDLTTEYVSHGPRNEKLWFAIKQKSAQALLDAGDFAACDAVLQEMKGSCRAEGSGWDAKKGTQLVTALALELQLSQQLGDMKRTKQLYDAAMEVEGAIPPPKITGQIREAGGRIMMQQGRFGEANEVFFQAFKHYDEAGHPKRTSCLKYLVLANMMSKSSINPFDCQEAKPYKNDPEIKVMTGLIEAAGSKDIDRFESLLREHQDAIMSDPLIKEFLTPLLKTVRVQVLERNTSAYRTVKLSSLAEDFKMSADEVEALLVTMILDNSLKGAIDQVNGVLCLHNTEEQQRYAALHKWTSQVAALHAAIGARLA